MNLLSLEINLMKGNIMDLTTSLGLVAAAITTGSYIPQAVKTLKSKKTEDISLGMYALLVTGVIFWLIYGALIKDLPLIIANGITLLFSLIILAYKLIYK
jgi:MtN3 and saliva related transmembrane protein